MRLAFAAVLALALLFAPSATAAPPPEAVAFIEAVERSGPALRDAVPEVERRLKAVRFEGCIAPVVARVPRRSRRRAVLSLAAVINDASTRPVLPHLQQIVTDLDAVQTGDPALRAGRRAWRASVREARALPRVKRPCKEFRRWRRSGWRDSAAPLSGAEARKVRRAGRADAGYVRAVRRLQALGVSRRRASGFPGGRVFRPILRAIDRGLGTT